MNLKTYLDECSRRYYNGDPIISDEVFDKLANLCDYAQVGTLAHNEVYHAYQMYSLQKFYEDEGENPLAQYSKEKIDYSLKLDGAAISTLYIDGKLTQVLTRGDGIKGKDITDKFLATNIIPHNILDKGVRQITGEIAAPKHIENARNYAAGAINLKDPEEFRTRAVEFFAYGVQPYFTKSYEEDMTKLRKLGFNTVLGDYELDKVYPCDGLVFRVDSNELFDSLGYTSKHPRGAYAKKERQEGQDTVLLDVEWQVGKSGKVTPVAILEPIKIGDAIISRATLNNVGFIEELDIQIGDIVHVIRSGEIIPCITHKVE
jgi:NAD-dependent DNA ligase